MTTASPRSISAIETEYRGYKFRSRLEARWAVLFDHLDIQYEYEPQGYYVGIGEHAEDCPIKMYEPGSRDKGCTCSENEGRFMYLPDFWLPNTKTWVEVKGSAEMFDYDLLASTADWGAGLPYIDNSVDTTQGLLLLGNIPEPNNRFRPCHPILQHSKGGYVNGAMFIHGGIEIESLGWGDGAYFDSTTGDYEDMQKSISRFLSGGLGNLVKCPPPVFNAYKAARFARFEYGARG